MDYLRHRIIALTALGLGLLHGVVWAEVSFPKGPAALWQTEGGYVAVGTVAPIVKNLPAGCTNQPLSQGKLQGVVLQGCKGWGAKKTGQGWVMAQGLATPKASSVWALKQGWYVGGQKLQQANVEAAGYKWQVGLAGQAVRQNGALLGGVKRLGKAKTEAAIAVQEPSVTTQKPQPKPTTAAPDKIAFYASIEPASGLEPIPVAHVQEQPLPTNILAFNVPTEIASNLSQRFTPDTVTEVATDLGLIPQGLTRLTFKPTRLYSPGVMVPLPKVALVVAPVVAEASPTLPEAIQQVDLPSPSEVISSTHAEAKEETAHEVAGGHASNEHGAPEEAPAEGHGEQAAGGHGGGHGEAVAEADPRPDLPNVVPEDRPTAANETTIQGDVGVLIPPQGSEGYSADVSEALHSVADAPAGSTPGREARLALAGVYLAWQRPEEAQSVLETLPVRADGLPAAALPRLLYGVAALARQNGSATPSMFDQEGNLAPHAQLWASLAHTQKQAYSLAIQGWPKERGILPLYPPYMRQMAQEAQAAALVFTGQQEAARKVLAQLAEGYGAGGLPAALIRLEGLSYIGSADEQKGLEKLAEAAETKTDFKTAIRAKFEFVRALHQRRDISDDQLRTYLYDLQQDWRGDSTERDMLTLLADLYEKQQNPQKALHTWQTLVQAFPRGAEMEVTTARMAQAFVNVFNPEGEQTFDPLTYMGLYYDFRELLPNDERGDRVQEQMAEMLIKANLFDKAAPILEQQLQFRPLDAIAQGRLTLLLGETYRRQGKPEEAVKLLDTRRELATTQVLRRGWALTEARALGDLNRPQAGLELLKPLLAPGPTEDKEAATLAAQLAWQGQDWALASARFDKALNGVPASVLVSDTAAQLNLFQLAYALSQQQGTEAQLATLKGRYAEAWPQLPRLADDVNAVAATAGMQGVSPEGGPLQALTTAFSNINALNDKIGQIRRDTTRAKTDREEYNRRMQYMELLPPPSL